MPPLPEHLSKVPVGREQLSREILSEHQRDRILTAATGVFAKRGYQGTTVDNIVSAAQIGVGSFYALFDGKEDCLLQAYAKIVSEAREQIAAAIPADRPWPEQACAALAELLAFIAAEPLKARIALVEVQTAGPTALRRYGETLAEAIELLRGGRAVTTVDPEPPATLEEATASGLLWLLHRRLVTGEVEGIEQLFPEIAEVVLEPYLGAAEAKQLIAASAPASPKTR
jgi:AcrR family transcriptional regulator